MVDEEHMYVTEETLHYVARFLERYDIQNKQHQDAVHDMRLLSNLLIEGIYQPAEIKVIRRKKGQID